MFFLLDFPLFSCIIGTFQCLSQSMPLFQQTTSDDWHPVIFLGLQFLTLLVILFLENIMARNLDVPFGLK